MKEQYKELLRVYKDFIKVFNNWETEKIQEKDYYNFSKLVATFNNLTDLLEKNNIIEKYGIKNYKVIENGEII